jgi:hypothetical protein
MNVALEPVTPYVYRKVNTYTYNIVATGSPYSIQYQVHLFVSIPNSTTYTGAKQQEMSSGNNNELEYLKGLVSQVSPHSLHSTRKLI